MMIQKTEVTQIKDLNANDVFYFHGIPTPMVCERHQNMDNRTRVAYYVQKTGVRSEFAKVSGTTVHVVVDNIDIPETI